MDLTSAVQELLVALLLYDDTPGGAAAVAGLLPATVYDPYYRDIVEEASKYLDKYGKPPGEHALEIVEALCARQPDKADVYRTLFESITSSKDEINREYVISQAGEFAQYQRIRSGISRAIDAVEKRTPEGTAEAMAIMEASLEASYTVFDPGVTLSDESRSLAFLDASRDAFRTGVAEIDRRGLGPARGRLHVFLGDTGAGKSWWLVHLGKVSVLSGLRVLYVSLELSTEEVLGRMMQAFFSITKRKGETTVQEFERDRKGGFVGFVDRTVKERPALVDSNIREHLIRKIQPLKKRARLLVKSFPTSQLTVPEFRSYLSMLEASESFLPDIILFDYPDLMDVDPKNKRNELIRINHQLRGIAVERNLAMATVGQLSKEGGRARTATKHHIAEAYGVAQGADAIVTFSQTADEFELGLARLFQAKGRTDKDKFTVLISQAYALGQFLLDSAPMGKTYWEEVQSYGEEDDDEA